MKLFGLVLTLALGLCLTVGAVDTPFLDIDPAHSEIVSWAVAEGITTGTSATTFAPAEVCTRAQVITLLYRAQNSPAPKKADFPFTDVPGDSPFQNAIAWAVKEHITTGMTPSTFAPDTPCTTAQILVFCHRALGNFVDATGLPMAHQGRFYSQALAWALSENLVTLDTFDPSTPATRLDVVTYLHTLLAGDHTQTLLPLQPADQNQDILPLMTQLQTLGVDMADKDTGALAMNLAAGSNAVVYRGTLYFLRNGAQTISTMAADGSSAIWDLYTTDGRVIQNMQIYNDKLYFIEGDFLSAMNLDGSGRTVFTAWEDVAYHTYVIYDGRIYLPDDHRIYSYDLTLGDAKTVYTHQKGIYLGDGQSLGMLDGVLYFRQEAPFSRPGQGYSIGVDGKGLTPQGTSALALAGVAVSTAALSTAVGDLVALPLGVETHPQLQDVSFNNVYVFTVNLPFDQVNAVSPTQLLLSGADGLFLFSLDGSTPDLALPNSGAAVEPLPERLVVNRGDYLQG